MTQRRTPLLVQFFSVLCCVGIGAVLMAGCSPEAKQTSENEVSAAQVAAIQDTRPNVLLIVIDTLRADHLGSYGYERPTSPEIDAFAASASRYERCVSSAPWTLPTHASMFTGKAPFHHGAHAYLTGPEELQERGLAEEELTLAEVFQQEAYHTGAFIANTGYMGTWTHLDQGFETYTLDRVYSDVLNVQIKDWLDTHNDKPFFLFVNYIDVHRKYNLTPREPAQSWSVEDDPELLDKLIAAVMPGTDPVPEDLADQVRAQYDLAILNVDQAIGELIAHLKATGQYDNTTIVLTSDHGEYFGEQHLVEHSKDVYEPTVWVPLITKAPGQQAGQVRETLASSTDIPHLILETMPEAFYNKYTEHFPDKPGEHPVITELYYTRRNDLFNPIWGSRFQRIRLGAYDWPYKMIFSSDEQHELYNLETDPGELRNLVEEEPAVMEAIKIECDAYQAARKAPPLETLSSPEMTPELIEELKALGYLPS